MALSKVTFFDNTNFNLDLPDKECNDIVKGDNATLANEGIYFTPKYKYDAETDTSINKVHHIAHNGHIYTLGSDVIKSNNEEDKVVDNNNSIIQIVSSLEANPFEKNIRYTNLNIDFSNILNRLSELENTVKLLHYGPEPTLAPDETLPNIVLYYIKYNGDGNPIKVDDLTETLSADIIDNNVKKILLNKSYFDEYTKDTYSDNTNYILKHNNGDPITISDNKMYDVIGIGLDNIDNTKYKITNICLPDENNNKYGREIPFNPILKTNIIEIDDKQIIKILDKQDTGIRISAIVYKKL